MLSNQLEQRIKDYHCMVMQLNRSQEEKNIVEKKLMEAQLKIDQLQQCIEQLKVFKCASSIIIIVANFKVFWEICFNHSKHQES